MIVVINHLCIQFASRFCTERLTLVHVHLHAVKTSTDKLDGPRFLVIRQSTHKIVLCPIPPTICMKRSALCDSDHRVRQNYGKCYWRMATPFNSKN